MTDTMQNKNKFTYRQVGDYRILNLTLPSEEANVKLDKWGMLHKDYLEKHYRVFFNLLLTQGNLYQHCADVENQAKDMFDTLVEQMKKADSMTEQLKEENQLEWIQKVSNICNKVEEIVICEFVII